MQINRTFQKLLYNAGRRIVERQKVSQYSRNRFSHLPRQSDGFQAGGTRGAAMSGHHRGSRRMTAPLIIAMPGNEAMAEALAGRLAAELGQIELHAFPDGETYLRFMTSVSWRDVALICTLDRPNEKILPLLFAAQRSRE